MVNSLFLFLVLQNLNTPVWGRINASSKNITRLINSEVVKHHQI